MKLFNHVFEAHMHARRPWTHFRIYRHSMHRHIVWGKLSVIVGQPHLEEIDVCRECGEQIERKRWADEGLNWCEGCQQLEPETKTITMEEYERRQG